MIKHLYKWSNNLSSLRSRRLWRCPIHWCNSFHCEVCYHRSQTQRSSYVDDHHSHGTLQKCIHFHGHGTYIFVYALLTPAPVRMPDAFPMHALGTNITTVLLYRTPAHFSSSEVLFAQIEIDNQRSGPYSSTLVCLKTDKQKLCRLGWLSKGSPTQFDFTAQN